MINREQLYVFLYKAACLKEMCLKKIGKEYCPDTIRIPKDYRKINFEILWDGYEEEGGVYLLSMQQVIQLLVSNKGFHLCAMVKTFQSSVIEECFYSLLRELIETENQTDAKCKPVQIPENVLYELHNEGKAYITKRKKRKEKFKIEAALSMQHPVVRKVWTKDGHSLEYMIFGDRNPKPLVLINAYGIPSKIWQYIIYYYAKEYKVITWNLRGTSADHAGIDLSSEMQGSDLEEILLEEKIFSADIICWCSGLKVFCEYYKRKPESVKSLVIVSGYFNPIYEKGPYWTEFDQTIGRLSKMIETNDGFIDNPLVFELIKKLFSFDIASKKMESVTQLNTSFEEKNDIYRQMLMSADPEVKEMITMPFGNQKMIKNYAKITLELQKQDIMKMLPNLTCRTLVVNAELDMITDIRCARAGCLCIKGAEYRNLSSASHWSLWENFEDVIEVIDDFWMNKILVLPSPNLTFGPAEWSKK